MQDICGVTSLALPSSQTSTELDCACVLLAHMYLSGCEAVIDSECVYRSYWLYNSVSAISFYN